MTEAFFPATAMPDSDWWQALWSDPRSVLDEIGVEVGMVVVDLDRARSTVLPSIRRLMFVRHETEVPGDHKI